MLEEMEKEILDMANGTLDLVPGIERLSTKQAQVWTVNGMLACLSKIITKRIAFETGQSLVMATPFDEPEFVALSKRWDNMAFEVSL